MELVSIFRFVLYWSVMIFLVYELASTRLGWFKWSHKVFDFEAKTVDWRFIRFFLVGFAYFVVDGLVDSVPFEQSTMGNLFTTVSEMINHIIS